MPTTPYFVLAGVLFSTLAANAQEGGFRAPAPPEQQVGPVAPEPKGLLPAFLTPKGEQIEGWLEYGRAVGKRNRPRGEVARPWRRTLATWEHSVEGSRDRVWVDFRTPQAVLADIGWVDGIAPARFSALVEATSAYRDRPAQRLWFRVTMLSRRTQSTAFGLGHREPVPDELRNVVFEITDDQGVTYGPSIRPAPPTVAADRQLGVSTEPIERSDPVSLLGLRLMLGDRPGVGLAPRAPAMMVQGQAITYFRVTYDLFFNVAGPDGTPWVTPNTKELTLKVRTVEGTYSARYRVGELPVLPGRRR